MFHTLIEQGNNNNNNNIVSKTYLYAVIEEAVIVTFYWVKYQIFAPDVR